MICFLTPRYRSSSLHAEWVSWDYQSGNKHKHFENQDMNSFIDVSIGKQKIKNMKNIVFSHENLQKSRRLVQFRKNMIISFCITFFQNLSRVMRHKKTKNFKKKRKKIKITKAHVT